VPEWSSTPDSRASSVDRRRGTASIPPQARAISTMHVIIRATVLSCAFTFATAAGGVKLDGQCSTRPHGIDGYKGLECSGDGIHCYTGNDEYGMITQLTERNGTWTNTLLTDSVEGIKLRKTKGVTLWTGDTELCAFHNSSRCVHGEEVVIAADKENFRIIAVPVAHPRDAFVLIQTHLKPERVMVSVPHLVVSFTHKVLRFNLHTREQSIIDTRKFMFKEMCESFNKNHFLFLTTAQSKKIVRYNPDNGRVKTKRATHSYYHDCVTKKNKVYLLARKNDVIRLTTTVMKTQEKIAKIRTSPKCHAHTMTWRDPSRHVIIVICEHSPRRNPLKAQLVLFDTRTETSEVVCVKQ
jgi:hypothetical protein